MTLHARRGYAQALLAVSLFSTSPVLIRWASGVNPVEITFWRLFLATLTVVLFAALTRQPVRWRALPHHRFALYGVVIALHFFLYVASLSFTSVAHSLALVYTAPLLIALLSAVCLHETLTLRKWLGVTVGVLGVAILAGFEPLLTPRMVAGDLLALGSSATFAIYSVIGRAQRANFRLFDYAAGVFGWGALWLLPVALWTVSNSRYDPAAAFAIGVAGVGPLGTGHTLYNAAIRRIPATYANLIATLEVVGGVALSALVLGELPSLTSLAGAAIVLAGILLVVL